LKTGQWRKPWGADLLIFTTKLVEDVGTKAACPLSSRPLEPLKGDATVPELASSFGEHPTMLNEWKYAELEGAPGVFEQQPQSGGGRWRLGPGFVRQAHA
jgi:hypothetical protein